MNILSLVTLMSLILLSACGGSKSGGASGASKPNSETTPVVVDDGIDIDASIDGQYLAVFEGTNATVTGRITGAFTFSRDKELDEVVGDVRITNAGASLLHAQHVRLGTRCPTPSDDTNGDGLIDAIEGEAVYGKIFFPLDGDLSSQASHDGEFPVGDSYGNYIWARATSFTAFIRDLRSPDEGYGYFKLQPREAFSIEGRVVVIQGVDEAMGLPATVRATGRFKPHQTLPIACGVIQKVLDPPGTIDDGTYPAETETWPLEP